MFHKSSKSFLIFAISQVTSQDSADLIFGTDDGSDDIHLNSHCVKLSLRLHEVFRRGLDNQVDTFGMKHTRLFAFSNQLPMLEQTFDCMFELSISFEGNYKAFAQLINLL